jgi:hypothetical protein
MFHKLNNTDCPFQLCRLVIYISQQYLPHKLMV